MIKKCEICEQEFDTKGRNICCSKKCAEENKKRKDKIYRKGVVKIDWNNPEEVKEHRKEYNEEYNQRIEVIERRKEYDQKPENKEKQRNYYHKNKERIALRAKKYHQKPEVKDRSRERSWKKMGIKDMTVERYNNMLKEQNYSCKICGRHQNEFKRMLAVDHNHKTGEVRGILCPKCNSRLEVLDNKEWHNKALKYLGEKNEI